MRKFSILALLYSFWAIGASAQTDTTKLLDLNYNLPDRYIIEKINIEGDRYVNSATVLSLAGLSTGQMISIPGTDLTRAIENLWDQKLFSDVKILADSISGNKIYLTIKVTSRPRLGRYKFSGIKKGQEKALKEELNINRGDVVSEHLISSINERVKKYYAEKGYPNAEVKVQVQPDTSSIVGNTVQLDINIDRGQRFRIACITFSGNTEFSDGKLRRQMKETKQWGPMSVLKASKLRLEEYELDKDRIIAFYQKHGYKDIKIAADSITTCGNDMYNIGITLERGNRYYFRNIKWAGNTKYTSKFLSSILSIKSGDVYNPELLERNLYINPTGLDVTSLYMDQGYLFFNATPVEVQVEGDSVDLEVRIFEGPQATIRNVTVTGNTKTYDHVILREVRTKPGQKFSRSDIIRSQRELIALGYFDQEKMNINTKPNLEEGTVDLEYVVEEKSSDQIEMSGGWSNGRIVGILGLSLNNFSARQIFKPRQWQGYPSGDGQRVAIRAQTNGAQYQSYNLSFTEPWFGGRKPNAFTISGFYSKYNLFVNSNSGMSTMGATVGLGKRLKWPDDFFVWHNSVSYQYYIMNNLTSSPLIAGFTDGYANNISFRSLVSRNSSSDPIYPRSGSIFNITAQFTPPYSWFNDKDYPSLPVQERYKWVEYWKTKFDYNHFMGFGAKKKLVLMAGVNFGFLSSYSQEVGLSPFERFYVGGAGLGANGLLLDGREYIRLRGYEDENAVTPVQYDATGQAAERGGTIYNRFTLELRYPFANSPAATIYGLAFFEAGNAWQRYHNFNPFDMKRAAGAGIRLYLPMFGLLGFDFGYGFDPALGQTEPSKLQFHFLIGQSLF